MPRNRNRQPGPIRRTTVSAASDTARPSRNLLVRLGSDVPAAPAPVRTRRYARVGGPDDWGRTSSLKPTSAAMTPAWSYTRSNRKV